MHTDISHDLTERDRGAFGHRQLPEGAGVRRKANRRDDFDTGGLAGVAERSAFGAKAQRSRGKLIRLHASRQHAGNNSPDHTARAPTAWVTLPLYSRQNLFQE